MNRHSPEYERRDSMFDKTILVVNGKPRAGKDTFALILNEYYSVYKYSIIDKIKTIAIDCGWRGGKTEKDRKFLADLKDLTDAYSDVSFNDILDKIADFVDDIIEEDILIIDMRSPEDIDRLKELVDVITVYIDNENIEDVLSNHADANVEQYDYDFVVSNNGTIEDFRRVIEAFLMFIKLERGLDE